MGKRVSLEAPLPCFFLSLFFIGLFCKQSDETAAQSVRDGSVLVLFIDFFWPNAKF